MPFTTEVEQEEDGRWLTGIPALPGVLVYGQTREEAITRTQVLALRVLANRLEHGESVPAMGEVFVVVAWTGSPQPRQVTYPRLRAIHFLYG